VTRVVSTTGLGTEKRRCQLLSVLPMCELEDIQRPHGSTHREKVHETVSDTENWNSLSGLQTLIRCGNTTELSNNIMKLHSGRCNIHDY